METQNLSTGFHSSFQMKKFFEEESLCQFNGFRIPLTFLSSTQEVLSNFKPLSADVILASFPKTGTTWLKSLLFSLIHSSSRESLTVNNPHDLFPTPEAQSCPPNTTYADFPSVKDPSSTGAAIFSTHLPYQILANNLNSSACKIVYVTREPKDTLISLWNFMNMAGKTEAQTEPIWPLAKAVEQFCDGFIPFGSYYDHVLGYHKQFLERPEKVFFVTYEELKEDPNTYVKRLAQFLDRSLEGDDGDVEDIVKSCSFETLSNLDVNKSSRFIRNILLPRNSFFRRGQVGDHLCFLEPEMIQRIDAITKEKFQGSGISIGRYCSDLFLQPKKDSPAKESVACNPVQ